MSLAGEARSQAPSGGADVSDGAWPGAAAAEGPRTAKPGRRTKLRLLGWVGAGLLLLMVGALAGYFIARSQLESDSERLVETQYQLSLVEKAVAHAEERNWLYYRQTESLKAQLEHAQSGGMQSTSTTTTIPGAAKTWSDGVYLVGEDIAPGTYDGVISGEVGYWARLKSTDGVIGAIITNGLPRGPFVLTIIESDNAVELRGVVITAR